MCRSRFKVIRCTTYNAVVTSSRLAACMSQTERRQSILRHFTRAQQAHPGNTSIMQYNTCIRLLRHSGVTSYRWWYWQTGMKHLLYWAYRRQCEVTNVAILISWTHLMWNVKDKVSIAECCGCTPSVKLAPSLISSIKSTRNMTTCKHTNQVYFSMIKHLNAVVK